MGFLNDWINVLGSGQLSDICIPRNLKLLTINPSMKTGLKICGLGFNYIESTVVVLAAFLYSELSLPANRPAMVMSLLNWKVELELLPALQSWLYRTGGWALNALLCNWLLRRKCLCQLVLTVLVLDGELIAGNRKTRTGLISWMQMLCPFQGPKGTFQMKQLLTYTSPNREYCVWCSHYGDLYIGETWHRLGCLFAEHLHPVHRGLCWVHCCLLR